jgi:Ca2+:H+ antiporter
MILPNYTATTPGPYYSGAQLGFISVVCLVLYGTFVLMQTAHRGYFLPVDAPGDETAEAPRPTTRMAWLSLVLLIACLGAVVLSGKALAPSVEAAVRAAGAPQALVGIIIATVVLMPEGYAAVRAARANRLQTSLNLALGSALASIGVEHSRGGDPHAHHGTEAHARAGRHIHGAAAPLALHRVALALHPVARR